MSGSAESSLWEADQEIERLKAQLSRFRTLWQSYRSALSEPFGKDRNEDSQITSRVDAAFQALDQLSKEG